MNKLTLKIDKGGSIEAEGLIAKEVATDIVTIKIEKGTDAMFNAIMFNAAIEVHDNKQFRFKGQLITDYKILNGTVHNPDGSIIVRLQML